MNRLLFDGMMYIVLVQKLVLLRGYISHVSLFMVILNWIFAHLFDRIRIDCACLLSSFRQMAKLLRTTKE